jgi:hypothetical protein
VMAAMANNCAAAGESVLDMLDRIHAVYVRYL